MLDFIQLNGAHCQCQNLGCEQMGSGVAQMGFHDLAKLIELLLII
jgi:hypothetical protein